MGSLAIRSLSIVIATVFSLWKVAAMSSYGGSLPAELRLRPGFRLELVYRVPASEGSWVSLACDRRGRLVASDQTGKLYLITPSPIGQRSAATRVVPLPLDIGEAQGLVCMEDDLYVVVNSSPKRLGSGLYRARDTNGDGLWDTSELLRQLDGHGEHGPHAVIAGRDGRSLYICCGNETAPTDFVRSRPPGIGPEDFLLAHLTSPTPYRIDQKPPAGWIARTDLDGKQWELLSIGYRNQYDLALNREGELFTYDSDMEYDIGTPWYRPTRLYHVTSGSDTGWRSGSATFPAHYPDTLPAVAELGPGSPTGLTFGYETNFPPPYREALLAADWGRGIIHALQLSPDGAGYTAVADTLLRAAPLPVTNLAANSVDGALYFTTGGRGIESAVYRLVYQGEEEPPPQAATSNDQSADAARALRHRLEEFHRRDPEALTVAWPALDHPDRFIRYAARIAVEHQPVQSWRAKALREPVAGRRTAACLALVRSDSAGSAAAVVEALAELPWETLGDAERREGLRAYGVLMARHGPVSAEVATGIANQLLPCFPDDNVLTNRLLVEVLSRLSDPRITRRLVGQFKQAWDDEDRIHLAHALCDVSGGWTPPLREVYFDELAGLLSQHHDSTMRGYLDQMAERALELTPEPQRPMLAQRIAEARHRASEPFTPARPLVRQWTIEEALEVIDSSSRTPDIKNGERLFAEAQCATCHRVQGRGGAVGPDLTTVANRFSLRDLLTAIIDPDRNVSDQYQQTIFQVGGRTLVGHIIDQREDHVWIATDFTDPKRSEYVALDDIEAQFPSPVSPMPGGLLDVLDAEELVDLMAFLRARSVH